MEEHVRWECLTWLDLKLRLPENSILERGWKEPKMRGIMMIRRQSMTWRSFQGNLLITHSNFDQKHRVPFCVMRNLNKRNFLSIWCAWQKGMHGTVSTWKLGIIQRNFRIYTYTLNRTQFQYALTFILWDFRNDCWTRGWGNCSWKNPNISTCISYFGVLNNAQALYETTLCICNQVRRVGQFNSV